MDTVNEFDFKRRKYMPVFPKAVGKPTIYIEGYPYEDDEPMGATGLHVEQINMFSEQLSRYFINEPIYVSVDSFRQKPSWNGFGLNSLTAKTKTRENLTQRQYSQL